MTQKEAPQWNVTGWEAAEHLRLTTFIRPAADVANWSGLWREVVGSDPDQSVSQPKQNLIQETGALSDAPDAALLMNANPERVDWILRPNPPGPTQDPPTLGDVGNALETFSKAIRPWLERELDVTRMAFGTVLMSPAPNVESGYKRLSESLPNLDPKGLQGASDFIYQINRPRESGSVPPFTVNRLSKWSLQLLESGIITVGPLGRPSLESEFLQHARQYVRVLELDINTSSTSNSSIPVNAIPSLFEELARLAFEIAEQGDIP